MDKKREGDSYISTEQKLQLIRKIREEHQMNQNAVRGREAYLYGKNYYEPLKEPVKTENTDMQMPMSTFRLRMTVAVLLFGLFYVSVMNEKTLFGIQAQQVYAAVEADYSPILFDFIDEIPYTLHE